MSHKVDWGKIKEWYVEGVKGTGGNITYPTLKDVADKTGAKPETVRKRAARGGWTNHRRLFISKVDTLRKEKKSEILAGESAQLAADCLKVARAGIVIIEAEMKSTSLPRPSVDKLMAALVNAQKVGLNALGETEAPETSRLTTIIVHSARAKELTEQILAGEGTD
jgi:hypothetical protein